MKINHLLFQTIALSFITIGSSAQLITTNPTYPLVDQPVTVIFDATQGNAGLAGYTGDVYAHTGVITTNSINGSDWKYVKADWGVNIPDCKMTRIGTDLYSLEIQPNIEDYYGVPDGEEILQMAFVFRSATQVGGQWLAGRTESGGDIFVDVYYTLGLEISFLKPSTFPEIDTLNQPIPVEIAACNADSVQLYVDDNLVKTNSGNYLVDTLIADHYGKFMVRAVASDCSGCVADTFYYNVRKPVAIAELPAGTRDGINYTGQNSVTLSLVAPGKNYVYVIGDFNDWEVDSNYYLKMTPYCHKRSSARSASD